MESLTRKDKWAIILKKNRKLRNLIFKKIDFRELNLNEDKIQDIAYKITLIYAFISEQIHNSYSALISLKIGHEFTTEQAIIIASICKKLNIKWESSFIDNSFKPLVLN